MIGVRPDRTCKSAAEGRLHVTCLVKPPMDNLQVMAADCVQTWPEGPTAGGTLTMAVPLSWPGPVLVADGTCADGEQPQ